MASSEAVRYAFAARRYEGSKTCDLTSPGRISSLGSKA